MQRERKNSIFVNESTIETMTELTVLKDQHRARKIFSSMTDLFSHLLKDQKTNETEIVRKITNAFVFLCNTKDKTMPVPLRTVLNNSKKRVLSILGTVKLPCFEPIVLELFCYIFCYRIKLIRTRDRNTQTQQFFGLSNGKPVKLLYTNEGISFYNKPSYNNQTVMKRVPISKLPSKTIIKGGLSKIELKKNINSLVQEKTCDSTPKRNIPKSRLTLRPVSRQENKQEQPKMAYYFNNRNMTYKHKTVKQITPRQVNLDKQRRLSTEQIKAKTLFSGKLKFYNYKRDFGFIMLSNGNELFVHKSDLLSSQIDLSGLIKYSKDYEITLSFEIQDYLVQNRSSIKAVNLQITGVKSLLE